MTTRLVFEVCPETYANPPVPTVETMTASSLAYFATFVATLAVAIVLFLGLRSMLKGNDANLSQRLMRWRVGLQFIAVIVIMLFVYLTRGSA